MPTVRRRRSRRKTAGQPRKTAQDIDGRTLKKGDTVVTVDGAFTGKVYGIALNDGVLFAELKPVFQPYAQGSWHAADRLSLVTAGK